MEKQEIEHLEYLLSKLGMYIGAGKRYCIIPSHYHDSCYIGIYSDTGAMEKEVNGINLESAINELSMVDKVKSLI